MIAKGCLAPRQQAAGSKHEDVTECKGGQQPPSQAEDFARTYMILNHTWRVLGSLYKKYIKSLLREMS